MTWDLADENEKSKMTEMERVELYEWAQNSEASKVQAETKELFAKLPEDLQEEARAGSMIMTVRAGSQKESDEIMKKVMCPRECVSIKGKSTDGKLLRFHAVRNVEEKDKKLWPEKVLTQDGKAAVDSPEKGLGMEVVGVITIDSAAMQTLEGAGETREELVYDFRKEGHNLILNSLNKQMHEKGEGLHGAMIKIVWNDKEETMNVLAVKSKTLLGMFSGLEIDKSESYGYFSFYDTGQKDELNSEIARMKKALLPEMAQIMIFKAGKTGVIAPGNEEEKEEWVDLCTGVAGECLVEMGKDASDIVLQYKDNFGFKGGKGGKKGGKGQKKGGKGGKGGLPYTPTSSKSAGKKAAAPTSKTQSNNRAIGTNLTKGHIGSQLQEALFPFA